MIAFERIAMLALGELPDADAHEVEDHVLSCSACALVLEHVLDLGERIADLTRTGGAFMLAGPLVAMLDRDRMVTRSYRIARGGSVACTVDASDIYSAMHLEVDTRGPRRLDLLYEAVSGGYRLEDVPFERDSGEVVFVQPAEYLRTLPTESKRIRVIAVDDAGERVLGEYTLHHTAYIPR